MKILKTLVVAYRDERIDAHSAESIRVDKMTKITATVILAIASVVLTILNLAKQYWFMTVTTTVLAVGFSVCAILFINYRLKNLAIIFLSILTAFTFTVYAVMGQNEGFAILWILIVPSIATSLVGLRAGTFLSFYFQVFLIIWFYTPLHTTVEYCPYTPTFIIRFPILYFVSMVCNIYLAGEKEYYYIRHENMAYFDDLTGINNRRYYEKQLKDYRSRLSSMTHFSIISIDINRLKYYNDLYGHDIGDELIKVSAEQINAFFEGSIAVCRTGGDEFMIISDENKDFILNKLNKLKTSLSEYHSQEINGIFISAGIATHEECPQFNINELEKLSDQLMYVEKNEFYNKNGFDRRRV